MWVSTDDEAYRERVVADYALAPDVLQAELEHVLAAAAIRWGAPRATFTVVEGRRQLFPARLGMGAGETERRTSLCALTLQADGPLVAADTQLHPLLRRHPAVTEPPHIRFYAGVPLKLEADPAPLGVLCVLDVRPRSEVDPADVELLIDLSGLVLEKLAARRVRVERRRTLDGAA